MKIPGPVWGEEKLHTQPSGKAPFEKWIYKKLDLEDALKKVEKEFEAKGIEITELVTSKIEDTNTQMVVLYRDVSFKSYEEIAKALHISLSYVYRLHKEGMDELMKG